MNKLFLGLTIAASMSSSFAAEKDFVGYIINASNVDSQSISYSEVKANKDGTVTILEPRLLRGARGYSIGVETSMLGVCKAAGFSSYLKKSMYKVRGDKKEKRAYVNSNGKFLNFLYNRYNPASIQEITCYNNSYSSKITAAEYIDNFDGTVTILEPKLIRGSRKYSIGVETSKHGVCKAAGFSSYFKKSMYRVKGDKKEKRAYVNSNGEFLNFLYNRYSPASIQEITCQN